MKLCAIYNVWSDWDWLEVSVKNIAPVVDGVIIIASNISNYGERCLSPVIQDGVDYSGSYGLGDRIQIYLRDPVFHNAQHSETDKRNYGLKLAKQLGYTHFLTIDADELYEAEPFLEAKKRFEDPNLAGLVCLCQTYFKSPMLTIGLDTTLVPFIHKLTPNIQHEFNQQYPFAWEGKNIRIDPTRSLNINSGVEMCDVRMHHYSWIRKDIEKKIRNSTAKSNLERSTIRQDLMFAKEGVFVKFYGKTLIRASVDFKIPEMNVSDI